MIKIDGENEMLQVTGDMETIMAEISYLLSYLKAQPDFPEEAIMPSLMNSYYTIDMSEDGQLIKTLELQEVLDKFERDSKLFLNFLKGAYYRNE